VRRRSPRSSARPASSSLVFSASVRSRRMRSIARLRPVAISQAPGFAGAPPARPALGRDRKGVLGNFLRRGRSRRGSRSGRRGHGPALRGRPARSALHHRASGVLLDLGVSAPPASKRPG
jgi:hypothetical protein